MKNKKSQSLLAYPYVIWSLIFIVAPILIILILSFFKTTNGETIFSLDTIKKY